MNSVLLALLLFFPLSLIAAPPQPASSDVTVFSADAVQPSSDSHFSDVHVGRAEFSRVLDTYVSVTGDQWTHRYSHVWGGDRTGTATLKDGTLLKWLVRPGGLATVTYPDGAILYLSASKPQ